MSRKRQQRPKLGLETESKFLRKGSARDWANYWSKEQNNLVDKRHIAEVAATNIEEWSQEGMA